MVVTESMLGQNSPTMLWSQAVEAWTSADTYWLATTRSDGRPHVARVLAVWTNDAIHFCTSPGSVKGHNLDANQACVVTTTSEGIDLVLEGTAEPVRAESSLRTVADAYASKYDWRVTVRDGAFYDVEGAPTAGPPPYDVFRLNASVAFGYGASDREFQPTRWRFHEVDD